MDKLTYRYLTDANNNPTNRLGSINDEVKNNVYQADLKDQGTGTNYTYDQTGNLTHDQQEKIGIDWTVYGKISSITNDDATKSVNYAYDAGGKRVSKTTSGLTTYYVRDAQGNPLALYQQQTGSDIKWTEQDLYGSSRLGTWTPSYSTDGTTIDATAWNNYGNKQYELNNHLGNVLATISDRRVQNVASDNITLNGLGADLITAQDYYPFGMLQPGRTYVQNLSADDAHTPFRYGFNGKENDNEVKQDAGGNNIIGGQQDYGQRIYDPRGGRFLSVDPLTAKYPELTPYQFASNTPIQATDLDGEEQRYYVLNLQSQHPTLTLTKQEDCWAIFDKVVVKVTGLPKNNYAVYTFTPWGAGRGGGVPGSGNYIEDFDKDFKKDPVRAIASGEYVPNEQILKDMVKDVALTIILHKVMSSNSIKPNPNPEPEIENSSPEGSKPQLKPYGGPRGGHHVPAKKAFEGAQNYDMNKALAIPNEELSRLNVNHGLITGAQMKAYKAFAATGNTLTWEAVSTIETNALIKGGMEQGAARATVTEAINNLKQSGVTAPTKIPWGGKQ